MAKKGDGRTFNVSVIGLSGTEKEKGVCGVGKSCLCNRFIHPEADKYYMEHISILSQSDFGSSVINHDHFLYWGEVTKTDEGNNFTFRVIEQTEFIDDVTFTPFKTGRTDPYTKRCVQTRVWSPEKLMYICKDQLGMETDSAYEQKFMPDGKLNIDGILCCFDVSKVMDRSLEKQVEFCVVLLNNAMKTKKPVVLVTTKSDSADANYTREIKILLTRKEFKRSIPMVETSALDNVNVEAAFLLLAHMMMDKSIARTDVVPYSKASKAKGEVMEVAREAFNDLLRNKITDSKINWKSARKMMKKEPDYQHFVDLFGTDKARALARRHLREELVKHKQNMFLKRLPDVLAHFLPDLKTVEFRTWKDCQRQMMQDDDFDSFFVRVCEDGESWTTSGFVDDEEESRLPLDFLTSLEAEACFRKHYAALHAALRKKELLEHNSVVSGDADVPMTGKQYSSVNGNATDKIPDVLSSFGEKEIELYRRALAEGKEKVFRIRLMIVGPYGVGKTTLSKRLLGENVNIEERKPTNGISILNATYNLKTSDWKLSNDGDKGELDILNRKRRIFESQKEEHAKEAKKDTSTEIIYRQEESDSLDIYEAQEDDEDVVKDIVPEVIQKKEQVMVPLQVARTGPEMSTTIDNDVEEDENENNVQEQTHALNELRKMQDHTVDNDSVKVSVYDFAGQEAFYGTHQVFFSKRAVYLLVNKLSSREDELLRNTDLAKHWISLIHEFGSQDEKPGHPKVILVGTFKDKWSGDTDAFFCHFEEAIRRQQNQSTTTVLSQFEEHLYLEKAFAIDNKNEADTETKELKNHIFKLVSEGEVYRDFWGEMVPAKWIRLEEKLLLEKENGVKILKKDEVENLNSDNMPADQLDLFLTFHHELGTWIFFGTDEYLSRYVLLDPQWLIDAFKCVIKPKQRFGCSKEIAEFEKTGKLYEKVLDDIWKKDHVRERKFIEHKEEILKFLQVFGILTNRQRHQDGDYFFAPGVVNERFHVDPVNTLKRNQRSTSILGFSNKSQFIPNTIFHRLIALTISNRNPEIQHFQHKWLDYAEFHMKNSHILHMFLHEDVIQIWISKQSDDTSKKEPEKELCMEVRNFVERELKQLMQVLTFIKCKHGKGTENKHMHKLEDISKDTFCKCDKCRLDTDVQPLLTEATKYWRKETCNDSSISIVGRHITPLRGCYYVEKGTHYDILRNLGLNNVSAGCRPLNVEKYFLWLNELKLNDSLDGRIIHLNQTQLDYLKNTECKERLTSGGTSTLFTSPKDFDKGQHLFGIRVALKEVCETKDIDQLYIIRERFASRITHYGIVPLYGTAEDTVCGARRHYFVSPLMVGGSLRQVLDKKILERDEAVRIVIQIASAIEYLHTPVDNVRDSVAHKDISSQNVVLDDCKNARLIDFGLAREICQKTSGFTKDIGKRDYLPKSGNEATVRTDLHCFGVLIREILTEVNPRELWTQNHEELLKRSDILDMIQEKWCYDGKITELGNSLLVLSEACIEGDEGLFKNNLRSLKRCSLTNMILRWKNPDEKDNGIQKCDVCLKNEYAPKASMSKHSAVCRSKIKVCLACMKYSFLNPVTCHSCDEDIVPPIGHGWGALLFAGKGNNREKEHPLKFANEVEKMRKTVTSKAPLIMGIRDKFVYIVKPEEGDDQSTLQCRLEAKLKQLPNERSVKVLFVYYSGHGEHSDGVFKFLLDPQTKKDHITSSILSEALQRCSQIEKIVMILDCCNPPPIKIDDKVVIQLNSCRSNEKAVSIEESLFSKFVLQCLMGKSKKTDCCVSECKICNSLEAWPNDDYITADNLLTYVSKHLEAMKYQIKPTIKTGKDTTWQDTKIAFYTGEAVEIQLSRMSSTERITVPLDFLKDIEELRAQIIEKTDLTRGTFVKIFCETGNYPVDRYEECDTIEKVMSAWITRRGLYFEYN